MRPVIGTTVHYVSYGTPGGEYQSVCRAAIVTATDTYQESTDGQHIGHVDLAVLNPEGMFFNKGVHHQGVIDDALMLRPRGGTWHFVGESVCKERGQQ